jgi:hypothetical protein
VLPLLPLVLHLLPQVLRLLPPRALQTWLVLMGHSKSIRLAIF